MQPAQAGISVLQESATSTHRSTRGDLDLIGNVERSMEVLSGKWKVYVLFFMAEVSDATAGSSSACREPRRRS